MSLKLELKMACFTTGFFGDTPKVQWFPHQN